MTSDTDTSQPPAKKAKCTELDLKSFIVDETLNILTREKVIIVKGKFPDTNNNSLLIFEKSPFPEDGNSLQDAISNDDYQTKSIMCNDIYKTETVTGMLSVNGIKLTIIDPATDKHIQKYRKPRFHYLHESPSTYTEITLPDISQNNFSINWIDNLLDHNAEQERILIKSEATEHGFVMAMDYKWDGKMADNLHCLAIVCARDVRCLRDLTAAHLPLLREIMDKCVKTISLNYRIPQSQLRLYIHYPPSFYHLHVHITHIHNDNSGALVDRAHLLATVIHNIELKTDYYQQATLVVCVNENDSLYQLYKANRCFE